jgi:hypothetical protein
VLSLSFKILLAGNDGSETSAGSQASVSDIFYDN